MCDYSLDFVASRPAKVGDKLVSTSFPHTTTRGFASVDDRHVAVCLLPGTELAFEEEVTMRYWHAPLLEDSGTRSRSFNRSTRIGQTSITTRLSSPTGKSSC